MKLSHINRQLENLLDKAEVKEALSPGLATSLLPSEKDLCRLAHLAGKLCGLRRQSCKCAVKAEKKSAWRFRKYPPIAPLSGYRKTQKRYDDLGA